MLPSSFVAQNAVAKRGAVDFVSMLKLKEQYDAQVHISRVHLGVCTAHPGSSLLRIFVTDKETKRSEQERKGGTGDQTGCCRGEDCTKRSCHQDHNRQNKEVF